MSRWLVLLFISVFVIAGASGCVLVIADEDVVHAVEVEKNRSRLAREIAAELEQDDFLQHSDIRVSEHDGVVTLYGDADLVARYEDVESVVSHLSVEVDL